MKLELVSKTDVSYVELLKDEKHVIGIKIRDAQQDEAGPSIKKVKPKSPAAGSFAVAQGDILLSVNGELTTGKTKKDVVQMIKEAGPCINLHLQYKIHETRTSRTGVYRKEQMTRTLRKVNGSFGFVLRKKHSMKHCFSVDYPFVSNISEGSQAYKDSHLQDGDRLIRVDDLDVSHLSLVEIATKLRDRDEAEFTFEYNIKVVDFTDLDGGLDLEIDVPVSDLGLSFSLYDDSTMYISNIKKGSIAERCGVFCEGDTLVSINGIETRFLTLSKADFLLRNTKKSRKIFFISNRPREIQAMSASDQVEVSSSEISSNVSTDVDMVITESTSGVETTDWKHVNTPASSNIAFSVQQNYFSQKFCHTEQMKVIDNFQRIVPVISSLKNQLSRLNQETANSRQNLLDDNCATCNKTRHSIKLCSACLAKINVKCEHLMEVLNSIIAQFVNFSTHTRSVSPRSVIETEVEEDVQEDQSIKVSIRSVVIALTEMLPNIFDRMPGLQESFEILADKVGNADRSCSTCEFEVKSVMLIVKKLSLLISLKDNSGEITDLIERLICCLLETKFTCDGKSERSYLVDNEYNISVSENLASLTDDQNSLPGNLGKPPNNPLIKSSGTRNGTESVPDLQNLSTNMNLEYLKIAHLPSSSESQNSEVSGTIDDKTSHTEKGGTSLEVNLKSSSTFVNSKDVVNKDNKNIYSDNKLKLAQKVWRSLDSFIRPNRYGQCKSAIPNREVNECRLTGSGEVNRETLGPASNIQSLRKDDNQVTIENIPDSNGGSTTGSSSRSDPANETQSSKKKVRSETMEIKMKNDGDGFGLDLSRRFVDDSATVIPVIDAIKSNSPSRKTGILKVDDRVTAINHQSTLGLTEKDFISLRNRAFLASTVILKIEFDVVDEEPKFGTFNVVLNRTLKTGLVFEEMKKGYPMVVAGVVKGSAAHRCGQLYRGDEITRFRCIRSEEFDSISCSYDRDEKVHMTVRRGNAEDVQKKSDETRPYYVNPSFSYDDFVPRNGTNYVVKSTAARVVGNSESLVYDQEVTLFRDLNAWDFGFLVGVDDTGRAYVTDIRPDSPAHRSSVIRKYDRIVEVNGVLVDKKVETSAVALLSQANEKVDLLIRRLYHETSKRS